MKTLRIATRKSPLALWQAEHVAGLLQRAGAMTQLVPLISGGDTDMRPIDRSRQVGLFTKRIQQALLDDQADIAVHSLKDLPTERNDQLTLVAVPPRAEVHDCLVSADAWTLEQLPASARVGTGSRRRGAQLLSIRDDLKIEPIRGNVQTRLQKLGEGLYDAILLAEAGISRLQLDDLPRCRLSLDQMLPAPGQGALGIEVRASDGEALEVVSQLDDARTRAAVTAERQLLAALHGGCLAPIAALASVNEIERSPVELKMNAVVLSHDGRRRLDHHQSVEFADDSWRQASDELSARVSNALVDRGAIELIQSQR